MLSVHTDRVGDVAIVECEGTILRADDALCLRDAVTQREAARVIVIDLSCLRFTQAQGLGMLVFLQRWAHDHDIELKLFNPSALVRNGLEHVSSFYEIEIAGLHEIMVLLSEAEHHKPLPA